MEKFLGNGSAFFTSAGNTSLFYQDGDTIYLVDCGYKAYERIKEEMEEIFQKAKRIILFVTHRHEDHFCSSFFFYVKYVLKKTVQIVSPELLTLAGVMPSNYTFVKTTYFTDQALSVSFLESQHVDTMPSWSLLLFLRRENSLLFYSGDCHTFSFSDIEFAARIYYGRKVDKWYVENSYYQTLSHLYFKNFDQMVTEYCEQKKINKKEFQKKIWIMHLDDSRLIDEVKALNYQIVETDIQFVSLFVLK